MQGSFFRGINKDSLDKAKVIVTGLAIDENCSNVVGTQHEPKRFRELTEVVTPFAMDGTFIGDVSIYDNGDVTSFKDIEEVARRVFKEKGFPFFIGGDHSVSISTEKVFIEKVVSKGKTPVIIHMDAHADIMEIYQGNVYSHATPNYHAIQNGLKTENLTMIGIRSYEDVEVEYLKNNPEIKVYGIEKIWKLGISKMLEEIISKYDKNDVEVYLSLDIDCVDPSYAPGTGTPEAFGLTSKELLEIVSTLFKKLNVTAMDIVEISPTADCNDITSYIGVKLFYEILKFLKD